MNHNSIKRLSLSLIAVLAFSCGEDGGGGGGGAQPEDPNTRFRSGDCGQFVVNDYNMVASACGQNQMFNQNFQRNVNNPFQWQFHAGFQWNSNTGQFYNYQAPYQNHSFNSFPNQNGFQNFNGNTGNCSANLDGFMRKYPGINCRLQSGSGFNGTQFIQITQGQLEQQRQQILRNGNF